MIKIDISFNHDNMPFVFTAEVVEGKRHVFEIGERMLADKLFYVLVGLDKNYKGTITGADWSQSETNNVLALGDKTMFVNGTVRKNIYKALRTRMKIKQAKQKTEEVINFYKLKPDDQINDDNMLPVAIARAHFREVKLIVANCFNESEMINDTENEKNNNYQSYIEKNFTNPNAPYIIEIC